MKIGLLGNTLNPIRANGLITGYSIASDDLMRAFIKYSSAKKIYCMYEPYQYQKVRLEQLANKKSVFISEYDLLFHGIENMPSIDILHSVKEDAVPLLYFREALKKKIPITITLHGIAEQHLIIDFFYYMLYMPFREYDAIICTSDAVYKSVESIFDRLGRILPNAQRKIRLEKASLGVDTDYFRPFDKIQCRRKNGIPEDAFVILWLGRFSDIFKADLHPLLHTFQKLLNANPQKKLELLLVGSEDNGFGYSDMLRNDIISLGIEEHTRIMFNHEISDRAEIYNACDVFTSPVDNIQETFGLTPVEAMACGIPQVVSDWDGYRDTVKNGVTGFLIDTFWCDCMNDVAEADFLPFNINNRRLIHRILSVRSTAVDCEKYYEKLNLLINDALLYKKLSKASRKRAIERFDLKCTVFETERIWKRLLSIAETAVSDFSDSVAKVDYCNDFKSYPTQFIDDNTLFVLTEFGETADYSRLPQHKIFMDSVEESELPLKILHYLKQSRKADILEIKKEFPIYSSSQIRRSVMYLFKYDIVKIEV